MKIFTMNGLDHTMGERGVSCESSLTTGKSVSFFTTELLHSFLVKVAVSKDVEAQALSARVVTVALPLDSDDYRRCGEHPGLEETVWSQDAVTTSQTSALVSKRFVPLEEGTSFNVRSNSPSNAVWGDITLINDRGGPVVSIAVRTLHVPGSPSQSPRSKMAEMLDGVVKLSGYVLTKLRGYFSS